MSGHQDDVRRWIEFHHPFQYLHAAHTGHDEIGEYNLWMPVINQVEAGLRIGCDGDIQALLGECARKKVEAARIIVNDYQRYRSGGSQWLHRTRDLKARAERARRGGM